MPQYSDLLNNNLTYGFLTNRNFSPSVPTNKYQIQTPYRNYNPTDKRVFIENSVTKKKNTYASTGSQYIRQKRSDAVGPGNVFDNSGYDPSFVYSAIRKSRSKGCVPPKKCGAVQNPFRSGVCPLGSYISTPTYSYSRY
jgi:hypothetical protein